VRVPGQGRGRLGVERLEAVEVQVAWDADERLRGRGRKPLQAANVEHPLPLPSQSGRDLGGHLLDAVEDEKQVGPAAAERGGDVEREVPDAGQIHAGVFGREHTRGG
ncbi:MAG: hypothetical protein ACK56I_20165, partial [bacterium]